MSNSYYDQTGILQLKQVTPVIRALFGGLSLDPDHPGGGEAYICNMSELNNHTWTDVLDALEELAQELGLEVATEPGAPEDDELLWALAKHFGSADHEPLVALIEGSTFEDEADLESLFVLAQAFDDGHGLAAIQFEGCWHCDKPRLFEFGGNGGFIGRKLTLTGASTDFLRLGESLERALGENSIVDAAEHLRQHVGNLLGGIDSAVQREQVVAAFANMLGAKQATSTLK